MQEKMTEKEFVPFGAEVYISNLEQSFKFYRDQLGFQVIRRDDTHKFISFEFNNSIFMIEEKPEWVQPTQGIVLRFVVDDLETYYQELQNKGVEISKALAVKDYGASRFYIKDPDGYQLKFASR